MLMARLNKSDHTLSMRAGDHYVAMRYMPSALDALPVRVGRRMASALFHQTTGGLTAQPWWPEWKQRYGAPDLLPLRDAYRDEETQWEQEGEELVRKLLKAGE